EYLHVTLSGVFLDQAQTLVQAVTDLGSGYWVLTPLRTADGSVVLINRGFVASDARDRIGPGGLGGPGGTGAARAVGEAREAGEAGGTVAVTGLLRMTEPRGAFLRHNDPASGRWYSRDVDAIARARGLTHVAPYFVDADAGADASANASATVMPVGG